MPESFKRRESGRVRFRRPPNPIPCRSRPRRNRRRDRGENRPTGRILPLARPPNRDRLPFTTKAELLADQEANPPYGTNLTYGLTSYTRLHQTSGTHGRPLRWLDTPASWSWVLDCWGMIYRAIGLRLDDRLVFPFS